MTSLDKKRKRQPWKYCKECGVEIKSPTGYCYTHWRGDRWTACHYGLTNASIEYKTTPHERRRS